ALPGATWLRVLWRMIALRALLVTRRCAVRAATAAASALLTAPLVLLRLLLVAALSFAALALLGGRASRQRDALALVVDLEHAHGELLADLHDLARVLDELL